MRLARSRTTPSPRQVAELEQELKPQGKTCEFRSYEGAGHAFFAVNRAEAAMEGGQHIWARFTRYLAA